MKSWSGFCWPTRMISKRSLSSQMRQNLPEIETPYCAMEPLPQLSTSQTAIQSLGNQQFFFMRYHKLPCTPQKRDRINSAPSPFNHPSQTIPHQKPNRSRKFHPVRPLKAGAEACSESQTAGSCTKYLFDKTSNPQSCYRPEPPK